MYQNIRVKNNVAETLRLVKELSKEKSLSDALLKTANAWFDQEEYKLLENVYIDNEEAIDLRDMNLSVAKLASDDSVYVIYYNDEVVELDSGDLYLKVKNYTTCKTKFSDESLVTEKIAHKDWLNIIEEE